MPAIVQKALPFALSHPSAAFHIIEKRQIAPQQMISALSSSEDDSAKITTEENVNLDPLLVNIFGVSTTTKSTVKTPKPKPIFNDGQKLVSNF